MECNIILHIQEVIAVNTLNIEKGPFTFSSLSGRLGGGLTYISNKGSCVVMLQFVIIRKRCAVSIQQTIRALVAKHLETAIS